MSFIDDSLMSGERIVARARTSAKAALPSQLICGALAAVVVALLGQLALLRASWPASMVSMVALSIIFVWGLCIVGVARRLWPLIGQEAALTDRRMVLRRGLFAQRRWDIAIHNIESVEISQSIAGRVLGYGTVTVTGVGSQLVSVMAITDPFEFRARIMSVSASSRGQ